MQFTDEWLVQTIEKLLDAELIATLRAETAQDPQSLWATVVQRKLVSDEYPALADEELPIRKEMNGYKTMSGPTLKEM